MKKAKVCCPTCGRPAPKAGPPPGFWRNWFPTRESETPMEVDSDQSEFSKAMSNFVDAEGGFDGQT